MTTATSVYGTIGRRNADCYRCDLLRCVSFSHVCDSQRDCLDGTDESNCPHVCPFPFYYRCSDSGLCMDLKHLCDGVYDCPNRKDEDFYTCDLYWSKIRSQGRSLDNQISKASDFINSDIDENLLNPLSK